MSEDTTAEHHQRLKAALHYSVGKLCEDLSAKIGGISFSKETVAAISELADLQIATYARDLDKFSKHGKRATINTDDVKLLCRRNPALASHINTITKGAATSDEKKKAKKKKDSVGTTLPEATGGSAIEHVNLDDE